MVFQIHTPLQQKPFCPSCGERFEVRRYFAQRTDPAGKTIKLIWSSDELSLLDRCITEDLLPYQVALLTGRTVNSVVKRLARRRVEKCGDG